MSRNCFWGSYSGRAGQLLASFFFAAPSNSPTSQCEVNSAQFPPRFEVANSK